jgi:hypothetical protein
MEIFLMVLSLSFVGVLVCAVLFAAATRDARRAESTAMAVTRDERFFVMRPPAAIRVARMPAAADVLALQIAHHVRLEQAAAELFRQFPTAESLHSATLSPLAG